MSYQVRWLQEFLEDTQLNTHFENLIDIDDNLGILLPCTNPKYGYRTAVNKYEESWRRYKWRLGSAWVEYEEFLKKNTGILLRESTPKNIAEISFCAAARIDLIGSVPGS